MIIEKNPSNYVGFLSLPAESLKENLDILKFSNENNLRLYVSGRLDLAGHKNIVLPKGLFVDGSLILCGTDIKNIPENLTVNGLSDFSNCPLLETLNDSFYSYGIDLSGCNSMEAIPNKLKNKGSLFLRNCTNIKKLPEGLRVNGSLDISGCSSLSALPDGLIVKGWLDMRRCATIKNLPSDLSVGAFIDIRGSGLIKKGISDKIKIY